MARQLSNDGRRYLRALLEYAEHSDGFMDVLDKEFVAPKDEAGFEAHVERINEISGEVHQFLSTKLKLGLTWARLCALIRGWGDPAP